MSHPRPDPGVPPRAITFDLWHTLIAFRAPDRRRYERLRRAAWAAGLGEGGLDPAIAPSVVLRLERRSNQVQSLGRSARIVDQVRWVERWTGAHVDASVIERGIADALAGARVWLAAGATREIDRLRELSIPLGLISNILYEPPGAVHALLRRLRLEARFDAVFLSCEGRVAKPSPEPFLQVFRRLGVPPLDGMHVGDHSDDIRGAMGAGTPAVRYTGLLGSYPPGMPGRSAPIPRRVPRIRHWRGFAEDRTQLYERARSALGHAP